MATRIDTDYYTWTKEQADALKRRSANELAIDDFPETPPFAMDEVKDAGWLPK